MYLYKIPGYQILFDSVYVLETAGPHSDMMQIGRHQVKVAIFLQNKDSVLCRSRSPNQFVLSLTSLPQTYKSDPLNPKLRVLHPDLFFKCWPGQKYQPVRKEKEKAEGSISINLYRGRIGHHHSLTQLIFIEHTP